jgi:hypothetical protein
MLFRASSGRLKLVLRLPVELPPLDLPDNDGRRGLIGECGFDVASPVGD